MSDRVSGSFRNPELKGVTVGPVSIEITEGNEWNELKGDRSYETKDSCEGFIWRTRFWEQTP